MGPGDPSRPPARAARGSPRSPSCGPGTGGRGVPPHSGKEMALGRDSRWVSDCLWLLCVAKPGPRRCRPVLPSGPDGVRGRGLWAVTLDTLSFFSAFPSARGQPEDLAGPGASRQPHESAPGGGGQWAQAWVPGPLCWPPSGGGGVRLRSGQERVCPERSRTATGALPCGRGQQVLDGAGLLGGDGVRLSQCQSPQS